MAGEAGVSVRLVQYYFSSKHELLLAGLGHVRARTTARVDRRLADLPDPGDTRPHLTAVLEDLGVGIAFGQYDASVARAALHHHLDGLLAARPDKAR